MQMDRDEISGKDKQMQSVMLTEEQLDSRVETEQVMSRTMQVDSQYASGAVPIRGKGYEEFDFVADNSDSKSEAGGSQSQDTGASEAGGRRPGTI